MVKSMLRAEGFVELSIAVCTYAVFVDIPYKWLLFALLFLVPDLSMIGYARNPNLGSLLYNLSHTYVLPLFLILLGWLGGNSFMLAAGFIWAAHIAFDRALGYGLKYPASFKDTHLQRLANPMHRS